MLAINKKTRSIETYSTKVAQANSQSLDQGLITLMTVAANHTGCKSVQVRDEPRKYGRAEDEDYCYCGCTKDSLYK